MAISRTYAKSDVMLITDMPLVEENKRGVPYSDPSNITLKDSLLRASMRECAKLENKFLLNVNTICFTYFSLQRYEEGDTDWQNSIVNKKNIPEGRADFVQVPWLKDIWISPQVNLALNSLINQIRQVQPKLIIVGGKWAFMFLCTMYSDTNMQLATIGTTKGTAKSKKMFGALNKYRSSLLTLFPHIAKQPTICLPILSPSNLFLVKDWSYVIARDYGKIAKYYRMLCMGKTPEDFLHRKRNPLVGTNKQFVLNWLFDLYAQICVKQTRVCFDVETRMNYKDCIGIAYNSFESLTIPFTEIFFEENTEITTQAFYRKDKKEFLADAAYGVTLEKNRFFWNIDDQIEIMDLLWKIMLHPNCLHIGQNYNYDCQYYFHRWKLKISSFCDTMILHHVLHNTMKKDLAMLASMYCLDYVYWKDDLESKDNNIRWEYCGQDCQYTYSVAELLLQLLPYYPQQLQNFYFFQQFKVAPVFVEIMNRGILIDVIKKESYREQFEALIKSCEEQFNYIFNEEVNLKSTPQVKNAFKTLLGIKPILNRKTKTESFGSDAMLVYLEQYPEWRTLLTLFLEYKSIGVFVRTFLSAEVDEDNHMRCDYNVAGTKTYRLASRKNVFRRGMNLANIPARGKIDLRVSLQGMEYSEEDEDFVVGESKNLTLKEAENITETTTQDDSLYEGKLELPNCKTIFLPDSKEFFFFDGDYSAIDLHFVVWESGCKFIKDIIRSGKDTYAMLASHYYQREISKADDERQIFKSVCHGANYLGKAPTLAAKAGLSVAAVRRVLEFYFKQCPEILEWHKFLEEQARTYGYIENCFGARNEVFDFTDPMWLNKLVAWQPQSSAAILVNNAIVRLEVGENILKQRNAIQVPIQTKMQTHDSISGQAHVSDESAIARLIKYMEKPITFEANKIRSQSDTVIIPADVKISPFSYGDCGKIQKDSPYAVHKHEAVANKLKENLIVWEKQNLFSGRNEAIKYGLILEN